MFKCPNKIVANATEGMIFLTKKNKTLYGISHFLKLKNKTKKLKWLKITYIL